MANSQSNEYYKNLEVLMSDLERLEETLIHNNEQNTDKYKNMITDYDQIINVYEGLLDRMKILVKQTVQKNLELRKDLQERDEIIRETFDLLHELNIITEQEE